MVAGAEENGRDCTYAQLCIGADTFYAEFNTDRNKLKMRLRVEPYDVSSHPEHLNVILCLGEGTPCRKPLLML